MIHCRDCRFWNPDPGRRMGVCPELANVIEVNASEFAVDVPEFLTPAEWGCASGINKEAPGAH